MFPRALSFVLIECRSIAYFASPRLLAARYSPLLPQAAVLDAVLDAAHPVVRSLCFVIGVL